MRATNEAGEVVEFIGGKWVPVKGAAPAAAPAPASERLSTGPINAALVAAGDQFNTAGLNARSLWARVTGNEGRQLELEDERAQAGAVRERLREEAPIASMVGGMLPGLATLPIGGGASLAARAGIQMGLGAGQGAVFSESGDMEGDALLGGGLAGAGMMAGSMVGRVRAARQAQQAARRAPPGLTGAEAGVLEGARRAGMQVTPGQAIGSNQARQIEAGLSSNPITSAVFQELEQANKSQLNRLAARSMGVVDADDVGPAVRAQAAQRIAEDFDFVGKSLGPVPTDKLGRDLAQIAREEATAGLPTSAAWNIQRRFEKGQAARFGAGGEADVMDGAQLIAMRSSAAKEMRDAFAANRSDKGTVLAQVVEAIDDSIGQHAQRIGADDVVERYASARDKWTVLRAMDRGGASIDGNVMPGQAARIINSSDKGRFWGAADDAGLTTQRGGTGNLGQDPIGDFYDALRFRASSIGKPIVGDSGTATRSAVQSWMTGGSVTGAAAQALRGVTASPLVRMYSGMSPEAANQAAAMLQAVRQQQGRAAQLGGQAGRAGGLAAPSVPE